LPANVGGGAWCVSRTLLAGQHWRRRVVRFTHPTCRIGGGAWCVSRTLLAGPSFHREGGAKTVTASLCYLPVLPGSVGGAGGAVSDDAGFVLVEPGAFSVVVVVPPPLGLAPSVVVGVVLVPLAFGGWFSPQPTTQTKPTRHRISIKATNVFIGSPFVNDRTRVWRTPQETLLPADQFVTQWAIIPLFHTKYSRAPITTPRGMFFFQIVRDKSASRCLLKQGPPSVGGDLRRRWLHRGWPAGLSEREWQIDLAH
jgi:hypothetical protein